MSRTDPHTDGHWAKRVTGIKHHANLHVKLSISVAVHYYYCSMRECEMVLTIALPSTMRGLRLRETCTRICLSLPCGVWLEDGSRYRFMALVVAGRRRHRLAVTKICIAFPRKLLPLLNLMFLNVCLIFLYTFSSPAFKYTSTYTYT